ADPPVQHPGRPDRAREQYRDGRARLHPESDCRVHRLCSLPAPPTSKVIVVACCRNSAAGPPHFFSFSMINTGTAPSPLSNDVGHGRRSLQRNDGGHSRRTMRSVSVRVPRRSAPLPLHFPPPPLLTAP